MSLLLWSECLFHVCLCVCVGVCVCLSVCLCVCVCFFYIYKSKRVCEKAMMARANGQPEKHLSTVSIEPLTLATAPWAASYWSQPHRCLRTSEGRGRWKTLAQSTQSRHCTNLRFTLRSSLFIASSQECEVCVCHRWSCFHKQWLMATMCHRVHTGSTLDYNHRAAGGGRRGVWGELKRKHREMRRGLIKMMALQKSRQNTMIERSWLN